MYNKYIQSLRGKKLQQNQCYWLFFVIVFEAEANIKIKYISGKNLLY